MKVLATLLMALTIASSTAQDRGTIIYEEDMTFNLPPEVAVMFKDAPKSRQKKMILSWDGSQVSYITDPAKQDERSVKRRGNAMMIRGNRKTTKYYNYEIGTMLEEREMMGKEFSIKDSIPEIKWKVDVANQRDILGYTCMRAITTVDTIEVVAWWTPQIQTSYGPDGFGGLPGAVLALGYGADKAILAQNIQLHADSTAEVVILTEKKSTMERADFDIKMEKRKEEMRKMWSGNRKRRDMRQGR